MSKHSQQTRERAKPDLQPFHSQSEWMAQVLTTKVPKLSEHSSPSKNEHQTYAEQDSLQVLLVFNNCIFFSQTSTLFYGPRQKGGESQWRVYLLHFPPRFLGWQIMSCMSFNICFCFLSDTINLKRKWIKVFERSPNIFHVHLKI